MRSILDNAILNTMYKGTTTIQDFCWDNLTTVPILSLLNADEIDYIRKIITSPRYSGNNKLKIEKIDELMHFRGFSKFAGGTNRIVYTHQSAPNAVFKVAIDSVGINDNPAEFRNQRFLKPYCCKVFECSPCGTIASFEKVDRITTFEEFYTIADDYFYLLSRVILGKYVMEDIGIDYFMNVGIRKGFGVVILDFPYLFELDGAKLECSTLLDDNTICGGEIEYDHGFNKLICSKCGRVYRARDLAKPPVNGGIIVCKKGENRMKFSIMQGDKVLKTINTQSEHEFLVKEKVCKTKERKPFSVSVVTVTVPVEAHEIKNNKQIEKQQPSTKHTNIQDNHNTNKNIKVIPVVVSFGRNAVKKQKTDEEMYSVLKASISTETMPDTKKIAEIESTVVEDNPAESKFTTYTSEDNVENTVSNIDDNTENDSKISVETSMVISEYANLSTSKEAVQNTELESDKHDIADDELKSDKHDIADDENMIDVINNQFSIYDTPALNDSFIAESEVQPPNPVESEIVNTSNEDNIEEDDGCLDDIIFVDELPNVEEAKTNVAYCKKIDHNIDASVYKDIDDLRLIPSELFEIYIKDSITSTFFRCVVTVDGDIEMYDNSEVDEAMKKLNAENFDVRPVLDITPEEEDAVTVDGDHLEEDELVEKLKSSSKKISLEDAE